MHRYLTNASKQDILVDHINKNSVDNRLVNLRFNTFSGNGHNKTKIENATSKYYGVYWRKSSKRWAAAISKDLITYNIGEFKIEEEAAAAYNSKARELYKEFANLNVLKNEQDILKKIKKKCTSSKYRGVSWSTQKNKWGVKLQFQCKCYNCGFFENENEAAKAYNDKALELHGKDYKHFNIILP
jgi:hypothetical protein